MLGAVAVRYVGEVRFIFAANEVRVSGPGLERRWEFQGPRTQGDATMLTCRLVRGLSLFQPWDEAFGEYTIEDGTRRAVASVVLP